jgi:hypothetical protein
MIANHRSTTDWWTNPTDGLTRLPRPIDCCPTADRPNYWPTDRFQTDRHPSNRVSDRPIVFLRPINSPIANWPLTSRTIEWPTYRWQWQSISDRPPIGRSTYRRPTDRWPINERWSIYQQPTTDRPTDHRPIDGSRLSERSNDRTSDRSSATRPGGGRSIALTDQTSTDQYSTRRDRTTTANRTTDRPISRPPSTTISTAGLPNDHTTGRWWSNYKPNKFRSRLKTLCHLFKIALPRSLKSKVKTKVIKVKTGYRP